MHAQVRSSVIAGAAVVGIGALAVAPLAPPPEIHSPTTAAHEVQLAAAPGPPLGSIPLAFIANQFQYCGVICPFIVQGAITVPIGAALAPVAFVGSLQSTGSLTRSIGAAAASVTGPANDAAEGIILTDVFRVVPKARNNLNVAVVQGLNVAAAVLQPAELPQAVQTARTKILAALEQPLPVRENPPTETGAEGFVQVAAVESLNVAWAVAFQAGELALLGFVQTPDAAAQELAQSGDVGAAVTAGAAKATDVVREAGGLVVDAVETAATNIRDSLDDPFPSPTQTPTTTSNAAASQDEPRQSRTGSDTARRATGPAHRSVATALNDESSAPDRAATFRPADDAARPGERRRANNESLKKVVDNLRRVFDGSAKREPNKLGDKGADEAGSDKASRADGGAGKKSDRES